MSRYSRMRSWLSSAAEDAPPPMPAPTSSSAAGEATPLLPGAEGWKCLPNCTPQEKEAAARIQALARKRQQARNWDTVFRKFGKPSLLRAEANMRAKLPKDPRTGEVYPLDTPVSTFDAMGEGVSAFMRLLDALYANTGSEFRYDCDRERWEDMEVGGNRRALN